MTLVDRLRECDRVKWTLLSGRLSVDPDDLRAAIARIEAADPWARFGDAVFDRFWSDGEPGDVDGGDLQEIARDCGLLGRTAEVDAGATHAEGCEWQPGMDADECDCWAPMRGPYRALVREQEGKDA